MEISNVSSFKDLDDLIPLIQKLYKETGNDKFFSIAGYISWICINFPNGNFRIWKSSNESGVFGYLIAHITQRFLVKECEIIDALIEENNEEITNKVFDEVVDWAKKNNCSQISIITKRDKAFTKKYGFETFGTIQILEI